VQKRTIAQKAEHRAALSTEEERQRQQQSIVHAEQQEQTAVHAVEENRKRNEIAHLRTTLHDGEPCPVCLRTVHEVPVVSPATQTDQLALQQQLEQTRTRLAQARQSLQQAETAAAAARTERK
jgi:hypothetical protein